MSNLPTQRLSSLLETLANGDPDSFEIDIAVLLADLRANVDNIKGMIDDLKLVQEWFEIRANPLQSAIKACKRETERLRSGLKEAMSMQGFEKLPGNEYRAQLNDTAEHVEWLEAVPNMHYRQLYPHLTQMMLVWNKDEVEKHLKSGNSLPFARLKRTKALQFYTNTENMINGIKNSGASAKRTKSTRACLPATGADKESASAGDQARPGAVYADYAVSDPD